ncbi:MAG: sulfite exporter TauE/SafE family protein, partial [Rhodospirillaceae bacterium]|nr:sulfite exporter TauE/SafE family protein [Rhodospirillaceae bacterium]
MDQIAQFAVVGFLAQFVDGAIGMAYGLTASSILLSLGTHPVVVSASVHAAEVFTTGASAASHWRLGNIDRAIFKRLLIPGLVGGALGAVALTAIPGTLVRPLVSSYLLIMGLVILGKTLRPRVSPRPPDRRLGPLALVGGTLDAIGGGGWGPIVTSSMIGWGVPPRVAIGTSNSVE